MMVSVLDFGSFNISGYGPRLIVLIYAVVLIFFFKQKTAYEMRISDWSSDVCSSDLCPHRGATGFAVGGGAGIDPCVCPRTLRPVAAREHELVDAGSDRLVAGASAARITRHCPRHHVDRAGQYLARRGVRRFCPWRSPLSRCRHPHCVVGRSGYRKSVWEG